MSIVQKAWGLAFGIILLFGVVYFFGYRHGKTIGDIALRDYISRGKELALENSIKFRELESSHKERENTLILQLAKEKEQYEINIDIINDTYSIRLRESEDRANSYRRQAEAGHSSDTKLASHAGKLDKALTEGITLVEEYRNLVRFLEQQIYARDQIINNDRSLINEK